MTESSPEVAGAVTQGLFDNLRLGRWLLGQGQTAVALLGYYDEFKAAQNPREKWYKAVRPAGDLVVDVIDTIPGVAEPAEESTPEFHAQAIEWGKAQAAALAIDWDKLMEACQTFLPILIEAALRLRG